jgi:hypothetical protein
MNSSFISEKNLWRILAALGVVIPTLISVDRWLLTCPFFELSPFTFIPLSGLVNGRELYFFAHIVLDLTHPLILLCYAVILTFVAARSIRRPLSARFNKLLFGGVAVIHLTFLVSYLVMMFLPVGDPVAVISTQ